MAVTVKKKIQSHGITVFLSAHPEIRRLKRDHYTAFHGNKFWTSSWLIMDFLKKQGLPDGTRILEVGCGWGLAGIYCAKKHNALVTAVDIDSEVFPYLQLHADINRVQVRALKKSFEGLRKKDLKGFDMIIGADICFWDDMVKPLKNLIHRAFSTGLRQILIADPGRPTFEALGDYFVGKGRGETLDWSVRRPRPIQGRILSIGPPVE